MTFKLGKLVASLVVAVGALASPAVQAGPVIIDGTDANDHGSASGGANTSGWLYMQRALENLASGVTTSAAKVVSVVGTTGSQAGAAIDSAFNLSVLPGLGWSLVHVDGTAAIGAFLDTLSTTTTGILYLPTSGNSSGDLDAAELAVVNSKAASINTFVGGAGNPLQGGGLFAMAETGTGAFGWLTTLIPGIVFTDAGSGGITADITLTAAGNAAFAGLSNADLAGADPWHGYFSGDLGGLSVLGVSNQGGVQRNLILGGGAGTQIGCGLPGQPPCNNEVPEPETLPLVAIAGLALVLSGMRRRKAK